ncbi:biotin/lipoyl-binding protein [Botrimarina hoheduenensis]|uniref:biotin/lipoyl-binding protein n=1 Tax=Botrimarina hoheduenensis TaxID=2528000 RepID=UPI0018D3A67D|nr:biotin/lipoyl-binding protein [Botrimarina hoheduenensis]
MPAHDLAVWEEFAALIDEVRRRANEHPLADLAGFYREVLAGCLDALGAVSAATWMRTEHNVSMLVQVGGGTPSAAEAAHRQRLIASALEAIPPRCQDSPAESGWGSVPVVEALDEARQHAVVVAIRVPSAPVDPSYPITLIEVLLTAGHQPALYEAAGRLMAEVAEAAAWFEARRHTSGLEQQVHQLTELATLPIDLAGDPRLEPTAMRIASEVRRRLNADRVAVLIASGSTPRVLALSGSDRIDHRGATAVAWNRLAQSTSDTPLDWPNDESTITPELADEFERCRDATHAQRVRIAPLGVGTATSEGGTDRPIGWLIVEDFADALPNATEHRLATIAAVVAPMLQTAQSVSTGPVRRLLERMRGSAVGLLIATGLVIAGGLALALVPVEHTITLEGELSPIMKRGVFSPCDATVVATHVASGERVARGDLLIELSDPQSLVQLQELEGRVETLARQRAAAETLRVSGDRRRADSVERLRLAADEQRLASQLEAAQAQRDLVLSERERLRVISPLEGIVTTWRPAEALAGRPVPRGHQLLTIADDQGAWQIELQAPDDRAGLVRDALARQPASRPLRVAFESAGAEGEASWGVLTTLAPAAAVEVDRFGVERRFVAMIVTPNDPLQPLSTGKAIPGLSVRAQVYCGQRSLAYVALHDAWQLITTWFWL